MIKTLNNPKNLACSNIEWKLEKFQLFQIDNESSNAETRSDSNLYFFKITLTPNKEKDVQANQFQSIFIKKVSSAKQLISECIHHENDGQEEHKNHSSDFNQQKILIGALANNSKEVIPQQILENSLRYIVQQILTAQNEFLQKGQIIEIVKNKEQEMDNTLENISFKAIINGCQTHYYSPIHQLEQIEELIRNLHPFRLEIQKSNITQCITLWSLKQRSKNPIQHKTNDINQLKNSIVRQRGSNVIQELLEEPNFQQSGKQSNSILNLIHQEETNNIYVDDLYTPFYYASVIVDKYQRRINNKDQENLIIINRVDKNVEEIVPHVFSALEFYGQSASFKILIITNGTTRKSQISFSVDQSFNAFNASRKDKKLSIKIKYAKLNDDDSVKELWSQYLAQHNVFVLQAQEVLPLLEHGDITLDQFDLVIFDNTQEITRLEHLQYLIIKYFYFYVRHENPQLKLPLIVASYVCYPVTGKENFEKVQKLFGAKRVVFSDGCSAGLKGYFLSNINRHIHTLQRVFSPHCQLEQALTMIRSLSNQVNLEQFEIPQEILYQDQTFFQSDQARFFVERSFQNIKDFGASMKKMFEKYPASKLALAGKQQYTPAVDQAQVLLMYKGAKTRFFSSRIKNDAIIDLFLEAIHISRGGSHQRELPIFYSRNNLSSSHSKDPAQIAQIISWKEIQSSSFVYLDFLRLLKEENYLNKDLRINRSLIDSLIRMKYALQEQISIFLMFLLICSFFYLMLTLWISILKPESETSKSFEIIVDTPPGERKACSTSLSTDQQCSGKETPLTSEDSEQLQVLDEVIQEGRKNNFQVTPQPRSQEDLIVLKRAEIISFEEVKQDYSNSKNKMMHFIQDVYNQVVNVVADQSCGHIKWKDTNTLDQLLRKQTERETEHIKEFKRKIQSFLRLHFNEQDERVLANSILHQDLIQVPFKESPSENTQHYQDEKSKWALMYFVLCLQEENPSGCYYEMIEEMDRLYFVGTSAIVLCSAIYLAITDKFKTNEKDLDIKKNIIIEKSNISRAGKDFGFHSQKYAIKFQPTQPNPNADASRIVQRLAGFFSLYLGIDACLYFLIKVRVIPIPQDQYENEIFAKLSRSLKQFKDDQEFQRRLTQQVLNNELPFSELTDFKQTFSNLEKLVLEFSQDFNEEEESKEDFNEEEESKEDCGFGVCFKQSQHLFLQCVSHSSFCDVIEHKQKNGELTNIYSTNLLQSFNYQRLEYLGDSILNFSIVKRIYFDTALQHEKWKRNYYTSRKLDDIKKFLTSNNFLGILLYNQFFQVGSVSSESSVSQDRKIEIPLLYDKASRVFSDEISKYYKCLSHWFKGKQSVGLQQRQSFSLNNYSYQQQESQEIWKPEYQKVIDLKVKTFADIFEALIGATFVASGSLGAAINFSLNMLSCDIFQSIEQLDTHLEQDKSTVTTTYGSKTYSYSYNLAHQEKPPSNEQVITSVFVSTLLVKNITQKAMINDKIGCLYRDIGKFLKDAYYQFETEQSWQNAFSSDLGASWLSFLHKFRTGHKLTAPDLAPELNIFGTLAQRLVDLKQRISIEYGDLPADKEAKLRNIKKQIIDQYNWLSGDERLLVNLEAERVQHKEIREAYYRCDIKNVNPMKANIRSFDNLLESYLLHSEYKWRVLKLYDQLFAYDELRRLKMHLDAGNKLKEGGNSSDSQDCSYAIEIKKTVEEGSSSPLQKNADQHQLQNQMMSIQSYFQ